MTKRLTVPWLPDLEPDRELSGKIIVLTQVVVAICRNWPPMPFRGRVNLMFFRSGLDYSLCQNAVWLALELGLLDWVDDDDE